MLHLIHPALVHFSVALIVLGGGSEVWGILTGKEPVTRWGSRLVLIGLASLVPTIATGYVAANSVSVPDGARDLLDSHERNGWFLLGLLLAGQFWKAWCGGRLSGLQQKLYAVLMTAVVLLAAYGAWLGGQMVYTHAVGVGITP